MKDLTQGSVARHLIGLAGFLGVSMLLQTLYFLVDLYFVSALGGATIAGVGLAGNLMFVTLALTQVLAVGTTTLIAQAAGRKDQADAQAIFNQSCLLSLLTGLGVFVLGTLLQKPYARALSADEATFTAAVQYLQWLVPAFSLQFLMVSIGSALRATGIAKPSMVIQMMTVGLNALLAPVLIAGWGTGRPMGAAGAGLATFAAVLLGVISLSIYFARHSKFVHLEPTQWKPRGPVLKRLTAIGLPAGGEFLIMALYSGMVYAVIRHKGADAQAGFGVGVRLMQSMFLPVMAISMAASPVAAQNFGARRADRVRETFRVACWLAAALMAVLTVLCHLSPETMVRWFTPEAGVIANGAEYLRIVSWGFLAYGLNVVASSMFQALGNTWPSLGSSTMRLTLFALAAVVISRDPAFPLAHLWMAGALAGCLQAGFAMSWLRLEFQKKLEFS
jgi:putative MATE family efflux protein